MTEREGFPAPPAPDDPLGGLTGATGSLTPDDPDEEFIPAETREMTDPDAARGGTAAAHQRADQRRTAESDDPGSLIQRGEETAANDRDGGYGSEHGLASDDPAYREEVDPTLRLPGGEPSPGTGERGTRIGGDEVNPEEHF